MRLAGQEKMGFYATPPRITDLIRERLEFAGPFAALDPCAGEGEALSQVTAGTDARTYGIEPDARRVEQARGALDNVLHSTLEEARISHQVFSLVWLNPPYDGEHTDQSSTEETGRKTTRKERAFLSRCFPLLAPRGVLILIVPAHILDPETIGYLDSKLTGLECWEFPEPEYSQFKQAVAIGTRRAGDQEPTGNIPRLLDYADLPTDRPRHTVPVSAVDLKIWKTLRLSREDCRAASAGSPLWSDVRPNPADDSSQERRPPLELHAGHLSLLLAAGCLDGIIGDGADRHMVRGKTAKTIKAHSETNVNEESGTTVTKHIRKDRYNVALKILRPDGRMTELG